MVDAPLVMPEVITGLSLLLLFVAMEQLIGWPADAASSPSGSPTSRFRMAYVTVIVQSRLRRWTRRSKRRPWTSARGRPRCSS